MQLRDLAVQCYEDSQTWFPDTANDLFFMVACMAGEAGETLNEAKKVVRGSTTMETVREKILEEATDTLVYCMNIFGIMNADPQWWYNMVRTKNVARFEPQALKAEATLGDRGLGRPIKDNPQA